VVGDVRNGFITPATAANVYRVVVSADGELDGGATASLRGAGAA
jgi:hypothetical protein